MKVISEFKEGVRNRLMEKVVTPMYEGGRKRLVDLMSLKPAGEPLAYDQSREFDSLLGNMKELEFFFKTPVGRRISDWLAE